MRYLIVFFGLAMLATSCPKPPMFGIVDKPIIWNEERQAMSLAYLKEHHDLEYDSAYIEPKIILLHHTVIPTFQGTFDTFNPIHLPANRKYISSAGRLNVSSQFVVDRDGTIYRLLPETAFARHVIGLNYCSIGVENVGGTPDTPLTQAQIEANIHLVQYLKRKYPIEYLVGHHEYQAFMGTDLWRETDPNYLTEKNDPGDAFMKAVRKGVKKLDLKGPPKP
ncbi:MAG: peptidoglycan recognition family protein [Bacteroidota bacterium]